jgi:formate hydrogenlyase subunit 3/multisubunit Na+/H+ antiporter MnhD subunit
MSLLLAVSFPLLLALFLGFPSTRSIASALAPWAALPALAISLGLPVADQQLTWLLLGTELGADRVTKVFLFLFALLWTIAGAFAKGYLEESEYPRFLAFFLPTMAGNLGLPLALDLASFYFFYVLMTFSAYGLIVHDRQKRSFFAGNVYIWLAILGEMLLLTGFWLAASSAGSILLPDLAAAIVDSPQRDLILFCLFFGFGVKVGIVPLHMWLPLAHPAAPTPASGVLSGAMIKAGLLGWVLFLPLGLMNAPGWSSVCILMGLLMAGAGVFLGLAQEQPKTVLAYSSISQMGFMAMAVGVGFASPEAWPVALTALFIYALHHGLVKCALFLGTGIISRIGGAPLGFARFALGVCSASLAGAPLTSGAFAKSAFKRAAAFAPGEWPVWIDWLLPLTAVGTTLLMGRFMFLVLREEPQECASPDKLRWLWASWGVLLAGALTALWVIPVLYAIEVAAQWPPDLGDLFYSAWPLAIGLLLLWRIRWLRRHRQPRPLVAPGDILIPVRSWLRNGSVLLKRNLKSKLLQRTAAWLNSLLASLMDSVSRAEVRQNRWGLVLFCFLLAALYLSSWDGGWR